MILATPVTRRPPRMAPPGPTLYPGASTVLHAKLIANPACADELLTNHIPTLVDGFADLGVLRWWIKRHCDTIRVEAEQYLAVFLRLDGPARYGAVASRLGDFAADLHTRGLPAEMAFVPYHQHSARYGHGPALDAAEHVFAHDTVAAISQIGLCQRTGLPAQAVAAASLTHLAAAFTPDAAAGYRALLTFLPHTTRPVARTLSDLARKLADPTDDYHQLRTHDGGQTVATAWQDRGVALRRYHDTLLAQRDPIDVLRTLLHEHHVRALGVDPEFERVTNHVARTAALRCLAAIGAT